MTKRFSSAMSRRRLIGGGAALGLAALARPAFAQASAALQRGMASGSDFGLIADLPADQTTQLQAAIDQSAGLGLTLSLGAGTYRASGLTLPSHCAILGVAGATVIAGSGDAPILFAEGQKGIVLEGLTLDGAGAGPSGDDSGLLALRLSVDVRLTGLAVQRGAGNGVYLEGVAGHLSQLDLSSHEISGIFAMDSAGLTITDTDIRDCGNSGIRVWKAVSGADGTIVSGNRISAIDWRGGGNGQNGNGINIYLADGVIVADNHISRCAFTAVRANTTNNTQIRGNTCIGCGEVAIFSEFGFSGSVIADNIIDGAAAGISITNLDDGGHLAVCTGNLVRNIFASSAVNPDTTPVGIHVEAETVVSNNVVEAVPGIGINAGWGPFLRNVLVSDNVLSGCKVGIGVSVAPDAGSARVDGNMIAGAEIAIAGFAWTEMVAPNLVADAEKYPQVAIGANTIT